MTRAPLCLIVLPLAVAPVLLSGCSTTSTTTTTTAKPPARDGKEGPTINAANPGPRNSAN